jgi:phosphoribosylamine-glycine ligase
VLTVSATGASLETARDGAYAAVTELRGLVPPGTPLAYRSDIARFAS